MDKETVVLVHNGILVIKKNKFMAFAGKWMKLENTMLSEIGQAPKKPKAECFL